MVQYKGASRTHEIRLGQRRKDPRFITRRLADFFESRDGVMLGVLLLPILAICLIKVPMSGEIILMSAWLYYWRFVRIGKRAFDFPYRLPLVSGLCDGSTRNGYGEGITYLGNDLETKEQIYAANNDLRTHMLVLGTTGSGKTEFLLGLVFNALVQNSGFIYVDGKGDPRLQKDIFRLARLLGREDDLLIINFINSGRDFIDPQHDKVTNTLNLMGNISSGMLVELIVALMDDASSNSGSDMWKGRAISFVAALTRPLTYLRDKGFLALAPEVYLQYFELNAIEELVWQHDGRYGETFDSIVAPLRAYLITLPGYQREKYKQQDSKTLEQHGYITMQLTRIFNDLTFNYGHIFKTKAGDVDFYDVVVNRRLLVVLLPALERAPESMRMLGKMIVGNIKQMMAGCLGNQVEGMTREIIDSRPVNANTPFYTILDEYGYYAVNGFAVAPAQARSLGFSVIFAAQDFSSLKKFSAEEADATWENTNIRAIGRLTSGTESETWRRIQGAAGEIQEALSDYENESGKIRETKNISIDRRSRLDYDDLAMQQEGEFTILIGKKERSGQSGGVRVIRAQGFYTAGPAPKEIRINDLIPVAAPEPSELPQNRQVAENLLHAMIEGRFSRAITGVLDEEPVFDGMRSIFDKNAQCRLLTAGDAACAAIGWYLCGSPDIDDDVNPGEIIGKADQDEGGHDEIDRCLLEASAFFETELMKLPSAATIDGRSEENSSEAVDEMLDLKKEWFREKAGQVIARLIAAQKSGRCDEAFKQACYTELINIAALSPSVATLEDKWLFESRIESLRCSDKDEI